MFEFPTVLDIASFRNLYSFSKGKLILQLKYRINFCPCKPEIIFSNPEPSSYPKNLQANITDNGNIHLSWTSLKSLSEWRDNPTKGTYNVYYRNIPPPSNEDNVIEEIRETSRNHSLIFANILDDTYSCISEFKVAAVSSVGKGPISPPICVMTNKRGEYSFILLR